MKTGHEIKSGPLRGRQLRRLRDFENPGFRVVAPYAIKSVRLVSRLIGIDLRQHHRRRAIWAGDEVVWNSQYRLYRWHVLHPLLQAGAQPVSQPSTPGAEGRCR